MTCKNSSVSRNVYIKHYYLLTYNFLQVIGWTCILHKLFYWKINEHEHETLWETVKFPVLIFQNAAILEILHAAIGLVKSNAVVTLFQVLSRIIIVCGVLLATPSDFAASSFGLPLSLIAWSITEIIRYSYYFGNLAGYIPYFLSWLRYSTFIILYPIGITGELLCLYSAAKYAYSNYNAWSCTLPNTWNFTFSYYYSLIIVMLLYIPLFPQLYLHMFSQRRKVLGTKEDSKKMS